MNVLIRFRIILILFLALQSFTMNSQGFLSQKQRPEKTVDTVKAEIEPIQVSNINKASIESYALFGKSTSRLLTQSEKEMYSREVDQLVSEANKYFIDTTNYLIEELNYRDLEKLSNNLFIVNKDIDELQDQISERLIEIQSGQQELRKNSQRWTLTLSNLEGDDIPNALIRRIGSVIYSNDSVMKLLQSDIDFLLTQTDHLTDQEIKLDMFKANLDDFMRYSSKNLLRRDMPPIWSVFAIDTTGYAFSSMSFPEQFEDETRMLFSTYSDKLLFVFLLIIASFLLIYWLRSNIKKGEHEQKKVVLNLYINEIFKKPFEVSLLISIYLLFLFIPDIPAIYSTAFAVITVYAIFRIALDILPPGHRMLLAGYAISFLLFKVFILFYDHLFLGRFILLASQIVILFYLLRYLNNRRLIHSTKNDLLNKIFSFMNVVFIFFVSIALIGNIAGTVSFSEYFTGGIVKSGFFIISIYVGFQIVVALTYLLLTSTFMLKSNIIRNQSDYLLGKIYNLLRFVFILIGLFVFFDQFNMKDPLVEWGSTVLTNPFEIGEAEFTLINVILFIFVIWLSIFISRVVRHILREEVFTRIEIERGMPGTIIMLVRIVLVTIGFFLAATASGMELSNLTIIIGAFSVGIGFGLQNIFNNLVSGLILAFERPIKEGDIVEVNSLLGRVKKIGIRSSIVKTFDGAEVIVPNGTLISNELINWTLSDHFRRSDIRVGVAYGTDPEVVIKVLMECAESNPKVLNAPTLNAYFLGFGDSSLDFRLLAWIDQDHRLEVESEIRVDINKKLKEAGIEIPFPQRDIYVKSFPGESKKDPETQE